MPNAVFSSPDDDQRDSDPSQLVRRPANSLRNRLVVDRFGRPMGLSNYALLDISFLLHYNSLYYIKRDSPLIFLFF